MKNLTILFASILLLTACQSDKPKTVTIANKYSLTIPSFLAKATALHKEASLQYQNGLKEFYVIVIDESRNEMEKALVDNDLTTLYSNDVKGYSDLLLGVMEGSMPGASRSVILDTAINQMPARLLSMKGKVDGIEIFYSIGFFQGRERFYQVLTWTTAKQEAKYKDMMGKIVRSLKEV